MTPRNKNRLILLAVVALFATPLTMAFLLNVAGWHPGKTRNSGTLIEPARDVRATAVTLSDGKALVWSDPQWHWTLLALPAARCAAACRERLDEILRMRLTLGRNAERLRIVYLGVELPAADVAARTPLLAGRDDAGTFAEFAARGDDTLALAVVDPNGLLMMRYPEGYSALGVRDDVQRLFH
jgi:hypothetical protein